MSGRPSGSPSRPRYLWVVLLAAALYVGTCLVVAVLGLLLLAPWNDAMPLARPGAEGGLTRVVPGAGITFTLPHGPVDAGAQVDAYSGAWWFDQPDDPAIRLFISAARSLTGPPEVDDAYLRMLVEEIEQASGNLDVELGTITPFATDGYTGRRVAYWSRTPDGEREYTAAALIGREGDHVFVAVYGPDGRQEAIDRLADQFFASLDVGPTPSSYAASGV